MEEEAGGGPRGHEVGEESLFDMEEEVGGCSRGCEVREEPSSPYPCLHPNTSLAYPPKSSFLHPS